ncbi:MAG: DUF2207 domain-containing protein [Hyphomicrobiales bacterium]
MSDIKILDGGTLDVTDTIQVRAERQQIRRGIYRDFNTRITLSDGSSGTVSYDILDVTRNGQSEPFHTQQFSGALRLFIGEENTFLTIGEHSYVIRYKATRQIRFLEEYELLDWNVTGNFWEFPIDQVSVKLWLPENGAFEDMEFFTGQFGETSSEGTLMIAPSRDVVSIIASTEFLPGEGLTVRAKIAKGSIAPPSDLQGILWLLRDNIQNIGSALILCLISLYYLVVWLRIGRDPPKGVVVPSWQPLDNISPALANYIENRGFSSNPFRALSAAFVSLAVKGHVTIAGFEDTPEISTKSSDATTKGKTETAPGEAALLRSVSKADVFKISKSNGKRVKASVNSFRRAIEREHRHVFFRLNKGYCIFGAALSVIGVVLLIIASQGALAEVLPFFVPSAIGLIIVVVMALRLVKVFKSRKQPRWRFLISLLPLLLVLFSLNGLGSFLYNAIELQSPVVLIALLGLVAVNVLFFQLMQAPTPIGQRAMDQISGLRTYLELAEADRLNLAGAPAMSPQHFETLLPYAIALEVEEPWSETFDKWLETATIEQKAIAQSSAWMGHDGYSNGIGRQMGRMSRSLEDGVRSSMPAPKTSSGGSSSGFSSGGFSGGGSGSSGGGGW